MTPTRCSPLLALLLAACGDAGDASEASTAAATTTATTTAPTTATPTSTGDEPPTTGVATSSASEGSTGGLDVPAGLELMHRLAGLWTGPATMTPLGTFPQMNMDVRAASGQVLFSRADLDAGNSLRFAFEVEAPDGEATLVYRNGGYFLGLLRDSRTRLVEHDQAAGAYRFCSTDAQGCEYIDARWTFSAEDAVVFDVKVKGQQHVYWDARRVETRTLPDVFPASNEPLASDADFPPMPQLAVDVSWTDPLEGEGAVWIILTTMDCDLQFKCVSSRSLTKGASAGSTSASLTFDQIHAGTYKLNAVLDRNGNLAATLYPDKGDGIGGLNQTVEVKPSGQTAVKTSITLTL